MIKTITYNNKNHFIKKLAFYVQCFHVFFISPSIKDNQSLGPFFVHDPVAAFSTSNRILWFYFIFMVTFTAYINHRSFRRVFRFHFTDE
ncbi:hypothetical protein X975_02091, partial [Stegodyphus mimosarum]